MCNGIILDRWGAVQKRQQNGTKDEKEQIKMNVYDFDNTIYRGESGVDLFLYYLKKDPKLLAKIPWGLSAVLKYKAGKMSLEQALENYSGVVEDYCRGIENIDSDVTEFWDNNSRKIKSFYLRQRRDDDVILSACIDVVLEEICKRLNIKNYIASTTDLDSMKLVNFCFRENKVKAFRERYPDAVVENFYTDSYNDQPMIDLAQNAYLVRGDRLVKIK